VDVVSGAKRQGRGRRSKAGSGLGMVDTHVDSRLRSRRTLLGLTFQQIQKYEHSTNGIAASRLWPLTEEFHVPVSFFDDDMQDTLPRNPEPFDSETLVPPSGQHSLQRRLVTPVKAQASQATMGGQ